MTAVALLTFSNRWSIPPDPGPADRDRAATQRQPPRLAVPAADHPLGEVLHRWPSDPLLCPELEVCTIKLPLPTWGVGNGEGIVRAASALTRTLSQRERVKNCIKRCLELVIELLAQDTDMDESRCIPGLRYLGSTVEAVRDLWGVGREAPVIGIFVTIGPVNEVQYAAHLVGNVLAAVPHPWRYHD